MYKFVLWLNDDHENYSQHYATNPEILLIGDGKRSLIKEDFDLSDHADKIDIGAQFILLSHGYFKEEEQSEYYSFGTKEDTEKEVEVKGCELVTLINQSIAAIGHDIAPKIHILSCYGGASLFYESQKDQVLEVVRGADFMDGTIVTFHGGTKPILFGSGRNILKRLIKTDLSSNRDVALYTSNIAFDTPSSMALVHKTPEGEVQIAKFDKPKGFDASKYQAEFEQFNVSLAKCFSLPPLATGSKFESGESFNHKALKHFITESEEDIHSIVELNTYNDQELFMRLAAILHQCAKHAVYDKTIKMCDAIVEKLKDIPSQNTNDHLQIAFIHNAMIEFAKEYGKLEYSILKPRLLRQIENIANMILYDLLEKSTIPKSTLTEYVKGMSDALIENIDIPAKLGEIMRRMYFKKNGEQVVDDCLIDEEYQGYYMEYYNSTVLLRGWELNQIKLKMNEGLERLMQTTQFLKNAAKNFCIIARDPLHGQSVAQEMLRGLDLQDKKIRQLMSTDSLPDMTQESLPDPDILGKSFAYDDVGVVA